MGPGTVDGDTVMLIVLLALPVPLAVIVYVSVTENRPKLPVSTPGKTAPGDPPLVWKTPSPTRLSARRCRASVAGNVAAGSPLVVSTGREDGMSCFGTSMD
jgi:hypothetical protein